MPRTSAGSICFPGRPHVKNPMTPAVSLIPPWIPPVRLFKTSQVSSWPFPISSPWPLISQPGRFSNSHPVQRQAGMPAFITTQPANLQTIYQNAQKDIDAVMNQVTDARGSMGNALNTLSTAKNDNAAQNVLTQQTLSGLRDTDVASAITKLNQSYLNLQATQQSMVKIQSLSLFNYIR
ncbi:MAG: hypothetical protein B7X28_08345 [Halothiobacillus sp. 13-55-253]|nr:MAG: hypothetical protein B7X28_08345 [Halothiobacillus sp. 13-55-253]